MKQIKDIFTIEVLDMSDPLANSYNTSILGNADFKSFELIKELNKLPSYILALHSNNDVKEFNSLRDINVEISNIVKGGKIVFKYDLCVTEIQIANDITYIYGNLCKRKYLNDNYSAYLGNNLKDAILNLEFKGTKADNTWLIGDNLRITGKYWRLCESTWTATLRLLSGIGFNKYFSINNKDIIIIDPSNMNSDSKVLKYNQMVWYGSSTLYYEQNPNTKKNEYTCYKEYSSDSIWKEWLYNDKPYFSRNQTDFTKNYVSILNTDTKKVMCSTEYRNDPEIYELGDIMEFPESLKKYSISKIMVSAVKFTYNLDGCSIKYDFVDFGQIENLKTER
jgi:hypothetical protein